ncbi:Glucose--fructose oxidoreductase precursor [Pseudoruegeria aquimaris]|uniref:Glucose--fructose oxidoreductase n=1 Tax=Pseudoruegeria aquimaris TaxID=393663 RepID=A0A1Y5T1W9_9RHOB|nr:Gfo/Idh/MocA family oxidoreductase [Pseudoruegeria aquimaris]SLN53538.1 Glucose--fructose oxidoreductase precursor [Pseudoruegeria aquimaris]
MTEVKVAVLGASGWMGRVHTMAYQTFPHFFGTSGGTARVAALVSTRAEAELGFRAPGAKILSDWRQAVNDPEIDLIDICLPDNMHHEVAKAALLAGKHVFCEKPLADTAAEARELADLARAKGVITRVGHAFPRNPVHDRAKEIIEAGEIGEIKLFKGCQHIDVYGDPLAPYMWRADGSLAPTGIIGDTGSHVFSFMEFLVGRVSSLVADSYVTAPRRPKVDGQDLGGSAPEITEATEWGEVTNPDGTNILCTFENGAKGIVDFSRVATGRKFMQSYEIYGTKGSLVYSFDEVNRLRFYSNDDPGGRRGFREIDVGPEHPAYGAFLPLPNFALGYNETKIIEAAEVIRSITTHTPMWPTFETGHHICQIVDACMDSARQRAWVEIA